MYAALSRCNTIGAGYKTMSVLLIDFRKIGYLPKTRGLSCLGNGNGIKQ